MAKTLSIKELLKGQTITDIELVEYSGYGSVYGIQIFLENGKCLYIKSTTIKFDQYSSDTCLAFSEHTL